MIGRHFVSIAFAALACSSSYSWAQCNGFIGSPRLTQQEEHRTCSRVERYANYDASGRAQCNDVGFNGPVLSGYASVFVDSKGVCNDGAPPTYYCDYTWEVPGTILRADGKGMVLYVDWHNGVWNGSSCGQEYVYEEDNDTQIDDCQSAQCCSGASACGMNGDRWFEDGCRCVPSPLFVVFDGTWRNALTSGPEGVPFVMRPGVQKALVAWSRPDTSSVGLLVRDRNGNGVIDDGSELYGTATPQLAVAGPRHGFTALAAEDYDGNGRIDPSDPAYRDMAIWFDRNHDGVSDADELVPLTVLGVRAISTRYRALEQDDRHGNRFAFESDMIFVSGGAIRTARVYDVYPRIVPLPTAVGDGGR